MIKFVSDLRQVGGFLHVFWFLPQNNLNIVEIGIMHYKTNKQLNLDYDAENYRSEWCQSHYAVTDENNDNSIEDLDIHYI